MKQRFTFLDIRAIVNELKPKLVNKFIQNFYTTQQRIIYIKFSSKDILLIEPGIRIHLTSEADEGISHFCNILRKKARRDKLVNLYQVGFDRVVVFELTRQKIVVEFFSGGNVFILDENDKILEVFRVVKELDIVKNTTYVFNPVEFDFSYTNYCKMDFNEFLPFDKELVDDLTKKINNRDSNRDNNQLNNRDSNEQNSNRDSNELNNRDSNQVNSNIINEPNSNRDSECISEESFNKIFKDFSDYINNIGNIGTVQLKKGKPFSFFPFNLQTENKIEFKTFNEAVEYFFSDRKKSKKQPVDKAQKVKDKQYEHIKELENMVEDLSIKTSLLVNNQNLVEEICKIHNSVLKNKIRWEDFKNFQIDEKNKGNDVAKNIIRSDFKNKSCIINLQDNDDSHYVEIDFTKSIHSNVQNIFEKKKKIQEKINKTKIAIDTIKIKTFKKEEKVKIQRTVFWFEKFNFCFSTDKKLIIGGKNSQQNEILVKKHLLSNNLYFHTESSGGSSVITTDDVDVEEAALVALCQSACWELNIVSSVWYVKGEQVSKTPPTGQFLPKGSFLIRGNKTYVNVYKLEYGVGLLFKTSDDIKEGDYFIKFEDAVFVTDPNNYEIDFAMPISAPYKILKNLYKFNVRILPGKDKKGKVVQGIISHYMKNANERIIKIIKRISVEEFVNVLPTNIKIGKDIK